MTGTIEKEIEAFRENVLRNSEWSTLNINYFNKHTDKMKAFILTASEAKDKIHKEGMEFLFKNAIEKVEKLCYEKAVLEDEIKGLRRKHPYCSICFWFKVGPPQAEKIKELKAEIKSLPKEVVSEEKLKQIKKGIINGLEEKVMKLEAELKRIKENLCDECGLRISMLKGKELK